MEAMAQLPSEDKHNDLPMKKIQIFHSYAKFSQRVI